MYIVRYISIYNTGKITQKMSSCLRRRTADACFVVLYCPVQYLFPVLPSWRIQALDEVGGVAEKHGIARGTARHVGVSVKQLRGLYRRCHVGLSVKQ